VTSGTTYYYEVSALSGCGEGVKSSPVSATPLGPPPTPRGLNATPGCGQVALSWNVLGGATGYYVYRSTSSGGSYTNLNGSPITATTYTDASATGGTTYYYEVSALNSCGESAKSGPVSATPFAPPTITAQPQSQAVLAGNPVTFSVVATGVQSYQWQFNGANISNATNSTYTILSVALGNAGTYTVIVSNPCGSITSAAAVLAVNTLVGYWPFNEGTGTVLHDVVNSNNGTIYNGTWDSGISGSDLDFDGRSTYVAIPSAANLNFGTNSFSISIWFNGEVSDNSYPAILSNDPGWWEPGSFAIRYGNWGYDGLTVHWYPIDDRLVSGTLTNTWHHAVFIRNGSTISLYIDAVLTATATVSATDTIDLANGGYMLLGGNTWDGSNSYYLGSLEQLRIYQGVLTQAQITNLYNNP